MMMPNPPSIPRSTATENRYFFVSLLYTAFEGVLLDLTAASGMWVDACVVGLISGSDVGLAAARGGVFAAVFGVL